MQLLGLALPATLDELLRLQRRRHTQSLGLLRGCRPEFLCGHLGGELGDVTGTDAHSASTLSDLICGAATVLLVAGEACCELPEPPGALAKALTRLAGQLACALDGLIKVAHSLAGPL